MALSRRQGFDYYTSGYVFTSTAVSAIILLEIEIDF
jgi:hypothetical protein